MARNGGRFALQFLVYELISIAQNEIEGASIILLTLAKDTSNPHLLECIKPEKSSYSLPASFHLKGCVGSTECFEAIPSQADPIIVYNDFNGIRVGEVPDVHHHTPEVRSIRLEAVSYGVEGVAQAFKHWLQGLRCL